MDMKDIIKSVRTSNSKEGAMIGIVFPLLHNKSNAF